MPDRYAAYRERMVERGTCLECATWQALVAIRHHNRSVRAGGYQLLLSETLTGDGRDRVEIRFTDVDIRPHGRAEKDLVVGSLDVELIRAIPDHFRERLPDNAVVSIDGRSAMTPLAKRLREER